MTAAPVQMIPPVQPLPLHPPPLAVPSSYPVATPRAEVATDRGLDEPGGLRSWMVIAAIVIAGGVIAAGVGLSGPDIPSQPPAPAPVVSPR